MSYTLFIVLLICHFAGDFTHLSRPYMLLAKRDGKDVIPIFHHALIHGGLMFFAMLLFVDISAVIVCTLIQIGTHTLIDIAKGRLQGSYQTLQSATSYWHWYLFGADQMLHVLVILLMVKLCSV